MAKLLKFELRKLFKAKSFYICLAVAAAYLFLSVLIQRAAYNALSEEELQTTALPTAADIVKRALSDGLTTIILAIFCALFVCEDYTDGTFKNVCAKGYAREKIYCSKLLAVLLFALLLCLINWILGYILGALYFEAEGINGALAASCSLRF